MARKSILQQREERKLNRAKTRARTMRAVAGTERARNDVQAARRARSAPKREIAIQQAQTRRQRRGTAPATRQPISTPQPQGPHRLAPQGPPQAPPAGGVQRRAIMSPHAQGPAPAAQRRAPITSGINDRTYDLLRAQNRGQSPSEFDMDQAKVMQAQKVAQVADLPIRSTAAATQALGRQRDAAAGKLTAEADDITGTRDARIAGLDAETGRTRAQTDHLGAQTATEGTRRSILEQQRQARGEIMEEGSNYDDIRGMAGIPRQPAVQGPSALDGARLQKVQLEIDQMKQNLPGIQSRQIDLLEKQLQAYLPKLDEDGMQVGGDPEKAALIADKIDRIFNRLLGRQQPGAGTGRQPITR